MWHGSFHNLISKLWENLWIYFYFSFFFFFFARFLCSGLTFHQHFAATWKTITFAVFYCYSQLFSRRFLHFFPILSFDSFPRWCSLLPQDVIMMISNRLVRIISFFAMSNTAVVYICDDKMVTYNCRFSHFHKTFILRNFSNRCSPSFYHLRTKTTQANNLF